jgi:hypothetical protein
MTPLHHDGHADGPLLLRSAGTPEKGLRFQCLSLSTFIIKQHLLTKLTPREPREECFVAS